MINFKLGCFVLAFLTVLTAAIKSCFICCLPIWCFLRILLRSFSLKLLLMDIIVSFNLSFSKTFSPFITDVCALLVILCIVPLKLHLIFQKHLGWNWRLKLAKSGCFEIIVDKVIHCVEIDFGSSEMLIIIQILRILTQECVTVIEVRLLSWTLIHPTSWFREISPTVFATELLVNLGFLQSCRSFLKLSFSFLLQGLISPFQIWDTKSIDIKIKRWLSLLLWEFSSTSLISIRLMSLLILFFELEDERTKICSPSS